MSRTKEIREKRINLAFEAGKRWSDRARERLDSDTTLSPRSIKDSNSAEAIQRYLAQTSIRNKRMQTLGIVRTSFPERIIGGNDLIENPISADEKLAGQPVGRIVEIGNSKNDLFGFGTGFMISPLLMMTNHHVLESKQDASGCGIQFGYEKLDNGISDGEVFEFDKDTFFYADEELDFAIVAVNRRSLSDTALGKWGHHKLNYMPGKVLKGHRVNVIQHPNGGPKKFANTNNSIVDIIDNFVHYLADTEPGSSGSPVFSRAYEVVSLHHSGVPMMEDGIVLNRHNRPWKPEEGDDAINWIANEGVRISRILEHLKEASLGSEEENSLRSSVFDIATDIDNADLLDPVSGEPYSPIDISSPTGATDRGKTNRISEDQSNLNEKELPRVYIENFGHFRLTPIEQGAPIHFDDEENAVRTASPLERRMKRDRNYARRQGYEENFLNGFSVPLPRVKEHRLDEMFKDRYGNPQILDYHHFSLTMNADWKLQMWSAANINYSHEVRFDLTREELGHDEWIEDPRIPSSLQIDDPEFYEPAKKFDRGHMVRRDDNAWGTTQEEMIFANSDTFHWTNCTPQHEEFNRAIFGHKGVWGRLEKHIANHSRAAGNRIVVFSGPILEKERSIPHDFGRGVFFIPLEYWKVIVLAEPGKQGVDLTLRSFGFLLEQESTIKKYGIERRQVPKRFDVGVFVEQQRPLSEISEIAGIIFPDNVAAADVMIKEQGPVVISSVEELRLA